MASLALAQLHDLEARMGEVADAGRAQAALDDISAAIHVVTNNAWVSDGALVDDVPGVALAVCCAAARRVLENAQLVASETLGPASTTYAAPSNDIYLTRTEQRLLRKAAGVASVGAVTLESPYPMGESTESIMRPFVDADGEAFPMGPFPAA